eukprot:TRINITY_DN33771_c0_g1_i1.p1 TRINITY_DN33771_c0_g1~~TRINITY_DN33771_c0_g1_i1.p1  ORF type:complete len:413 (-),score=49.91 TRINITY_DN33771_c0_g1_i1:69-1307(-)
MNRTGSEGVSGPYELGYTVHDMAWSPSAGGKGTGMLACSSFIVDAPNFVDVMTVDASSAQAVRGSVARLPHPFPATRVRWLTQDLLVTSCDCVRVWSSSGELRTLLQHETNPAGWCTPITSVDGFMAAGKAILASCDVYGIVALWDVERGVKQHAIDLGQPLYDCAFGPEGLLAVAGEQGDCFVIDPREPSKDVSVFSLKQRARGPARIAWGSRQDLLAIAWQGEAGGLALYGGGARPQRGVSPQLLSQSGVGLASTVADLKWSPAYSDMLCCAKEDGAVEVWQFPPGLDCYGSAATSGPCFRWSPGGPNAGACTALALSGEVRPGEHVLALATMPTDQQNASKGGSLWLAGLPQPTQQRPSSSIGGPLSTTSGAAPTCAMEAASASARTEEANGRGLGMGQAPGSSAIFGR